jgi:LytS/YehU family sensor histidine kinase
MDAKRTASVAMLSALGIVLSAISLNIAPILSTVGQGGAALDLSHVATFIAAIFGGPFVGAAVGLLGGLYAGYYFGFVFGQGLVAVVGVPIGKAMTGLMAGLLYKKLRIGNGSQHSWLAVPATLLSYVPESIYTVLYFLYIMTLVNGAGMAYLIPLVIPKAWIEIVVMSVLMGALAGNTGFREFIKRYLYVQKSYSLQNRP